jgi:hypothetical protein
MTLHAAISHPDALAVSFGCVTAVCLISILSGGAEERARKRSLVCTHKTATLLGVALLWVLSLAAQKEPPPQPPTNPPPSSVRGVIRLYFHDPDGRLVPVDSGVEVRP